MMFNARSGYLNSQQDSQKDEAIVGFDSIEFFKLMQIEDCQGNSIVYEYKELVYKCNSPDNFLEQLFEDLLERLDEWNVIEHLVSFMNIEIGRSANDLFLRDFSSLLELQNLLFDDKLVWSVNYPSHNYYKVQLIVPILKY